MAMKNTALSSGSACTSASLEPSYVLRALGATDDIAHSSIRFGIGRFTTEEEVDYVIEKTIDTVERLRELRYERLVTHSTRRAADFIYLILQPALGDGPGRDRYHHDQLVATLIACRGHIPCYVHVQGWHGFQAVALSTPFHIKSPLPGPAKQKKIGYATTNRASAPSMLYPPLNVILPTPMACTSHHVI